MLSEAKNFHRALFSVASEAIIVADLDRRMQWVNAAAEEMFGYPSQKFLGHTTLMLYADPEDYLAQGNKRFNKTAKTDHMRYVTKYKRANGEVFMGETVGAPIFDENNERIGFFGVIRDVSETHQLMAQIRRSEQRFEAFARASSDWFWEMDADLRFTYLSARVQDIIGLPAEFFVGKRRADMINGSDANMRRHMNDLEARRPFRDFTYIIDTPSGRPCAVSISGAPFYTDDGEFAGYRGTACDATGAVEAKKLALENQQLQLELANQKREAEARREFAMTVSHEYRTPIAIIDGMLRRLRRLTEVKDAARAVEILDRISASTKRMVRLLETMLAASRDNRKTLTLEKAEMSFQDFLSDILLEMGEAKRSHNVRCDWREGRYEMMGDERLLRNAFANVIENAIKYSPQADHVDVSVGNDGVMIETRVRDYGVGIPKEEIDKLFTRFFRASTATGIAGTGLGLNLTRQIIEQHGGEIKVDSQEGEGTEITVRLPVYAAEAEEACSAN